MSGLSGVSRNFPLSPQASAPYSFSASRYNPVKVEKATNCQIWVIIIDCCRWERHICTVWFISAYRSSTVHTLRRSVRPCWTRNSLPDNLTPRAKSISSLWLDLKLIENPSSHNEHEMSEPKDIELAFNLHGRTIIQLTRVLMKTEWMLLRD